MSIYLGMYVCENSICKRAYIHQTYLVLGYISLDSNCKFERNGVEISKKKYDSSKLSLRYLFYIYMQDDIEI